jgi:hypothetical protein
MERRSFYHSFPRARRGESQRKTIERGLRVLGSFKELGLVLAPEEIKWTQPKIDGNDRVILNSQQRISFTELSRRQLKDHAQRFGPLALEFSIDTLRRLGALPVIYIPQHLKDGRNLSSAGSLVVATIGDIKYTLNHLHTLSRLRDIDFVKQHAKNADGVSSVVEECIINLQNTDDNNNIVANHPVKLTDIEHLLSYVGYRNSPLELMVGALNLIQNLFCATDDERHDDLLAYYRQREWRIMAGLGYADGVSLGHLASEAEKKRLLDVDSEFWAKEIAFEGTVSRRIDRAFIISELNGQHVSELISRLIVPPEAQAAAKVLFGKKVVVR